MFDLCAAARMRPAQAGHMWHVRLGLQDIGRAMMNTARPIDSEGAGHSIERLAALTTLAHFSVSSDTSLPNCAGVIGVPSPPRSAMRFLILGSASASLNVLLRISTASAGTPFGPATP